MFPFRVTPLGENHLTFLPVLINSPCFLRISFLFLLHTKFLFVRVVDYSTVWKNVNLFDSMEFILGFAQSANTQQEHGGMKGIRRDDVERKSNAPRISLQRHSLFTLPRLRWLVGFAKGYRNKYLLKIFTFHWLKLRP